MPEKIFFNTSLPRAGSTLLQNVLGQNPDFYVTPTSGVFDMLHASRAIYTDNIEFQAQDSTLMDTGFKGYLKAGLFGFFDAVTDKKYAVDKCRGWSIHYDFTNFFYEQPKMVCMVRDLRAIYASMEKNWRKNPHKDHHMTNWHSLTGTTTDKRIWMWAQQPPVGVALDRLYQIILQGIHKNILFVRFEDFTKDPETEMRKIYEFFEVPYYNHDYDNVPQITQEDDRVYGVFGDHIIRHKIEPLKEDFLEVLGKGNCDAIVQSYSWFYDVFGYSR